MPAPAGPRCSSHSAAAAGWQCTGCEKRLCLDCAAKRKMGQGAVVTCRRCGSLARTLTVKRGPGAFRALAWDAFAYPFSRRGLLVMLAAGIVFTFLAFFGGWGARLASGARWSLLFLVIRTSALGNHDVPETEEASHPRELFGAALRGFFALALSLVPFAIYLFFKLSSVTGMLDLLSGANATIPLWRDPLAILALALGAAWGPLAVMLAAIHTPWLVTLNPLAVGSIVRRLGTDYLLAMSLFWGTFAASWYVDRVSAAFVSALPVPILPRIVAETMMLYLPLVYARVLGLLLFTRGADLGYGRAEDAEEPVLGALEPSEEAITTAPAQVDAIELPALPKPSRVAAIEPARHASPPPVRPPASMRPPAPAPSEDLMPEDDFLREMQDEASRKAAAAPTLPPDAPDRSDAAEALSFLPPANAPTLPELPPAPPPPAAPAGTWGDLEFLDDSALATIAVADAATIAAIQAKSRK